MAGYEQGYYCPECMKAKKQVLMNRGAVICTCPSCNHKAILPVSDIQEEVKASESREKQYPKASSPIFEHFNGFSSAYQGTNSPRKKAT